MPIETRLFKVFKNTNKDNITAYPFKDGIFFIRYSNLFFFHYVNLFLKAFKHILTHLYSILVTIQFIISASLLLN